MITYTKRNPYLKIDNLNQALSITIFSPQTEFSLVKSIKKLGLQSKFSLIEQCSEIHFLAYTWYTLGTYISFIRPIYLKYLLGQKILLEWNISEEIKSSRNEQLHKQIFTSKTLLKNGIIRKPFTEQIGPSWNEIGPLVKIDATY